MRCEKSSGMQIERTAKVIQEALMEAAASVRNRKGGMSRGGTHHRSPVRLAGKPFDCVSIRVFLVQSCINNASVCKQSY